MTKQLWNILSFLPSLWSYRRREMQYTLSHMEERLRAVHELETHFNYTRISTRPSTCPSLPRLMMDRLSTRELNHIDNCPHCRHELESAGGWRRFTRWVSISDIAAAGAPLQCPKCNSPRIHISRAVFPNIIVKVFGLDTFRCTACGRKSHLWTGFHIRKWVLHIARSNGRHH